MTIQRFDILVRDARQQSGDKAYSSTSGVRLSEWQRFGREAQTAIFQRILNTHASVFNRQIEIPVTQGVATVPIPATNPNAVNLTGNIINISYSFDGNPVNYYKLNLRTPSQEISFPAYPEGYFLRDGNIVLTPIPNQGAGSLRIDFQYDIPDLDVRRALITDTGGGAGGPLTFAVDRTLVTETEDDLANGIVDYVCVVDNNGNFLAKNLPVFLSDPAYPSPYDKTTHTLTLARLLTPAEDSAILNAITFHDGPWLTFGKYTSTHSQLMDNCERYLTHSLARFVQMRDSNSETTITKQHLDELLDEIMASFSDLEEDITPIPILDTSFFYEL